MLFRSLRAVWISFAGRVTAQIVGAVATVTLGVLVLGKGQPSRSPSADRPAGILVATPVRTHDETVIVLLPVRTDGTVDALEAARVAEAYERTTAPSRPDLGRRPGARPQTPTDRRVLRSADLLDDSHATPSSQHE